MSALLILLVSVLQTAAIAFGGPTILIGFMHMAAGSQNAARRVLLGIALCAGGLAMPGAPINYLQLAPNEIHLLPVRQPSLNKTA